VTSITNANTLTQASYTYDAFDRVASFTDSEGWVATYAGACPRVGLWPNPGDAADRVTSVTYPDGTAETWTYNRLDLTSYQDRAGRTP
jgi:YD repeat-containing protein